MTDTNNEHKNTRNKSRIRIELQYLPPVSYFRHCLSADSVVLEACETYQKQTFRNRCEILTANGKEALIIPVEHVGSQQLIKDVKIDYSQRWQQVHERTIRSAYGKSPFFEFFMDGFSAVWARKHVYLWDLNYEMLTLCLHNLKLKLHLEYTEQYLLPDNEYLKEEIDLRGKIEPHEYTIYRQNGAKTYQQVFGNKFVKDLSIIDLLFCAVLDSSELLQQN